MLIIRGVNIFPTQIEDAILECTGLAPHFYLEITRDKNLDNMVIHVERQAKAEASCVARELAHYVKSYYGITVLVNVLPPGGIERSQGKAKRILDRRKL